MRVIRLHEIVLYAFGMIFILAGAVGIVISLYAMPYLVFGVSYDLPEIITQFGIWFAQIQHTDKAIQLFVLLFPTILFGSIFIFIGYLIISWVDHRIRAGVYERVSKVRKQNKVITSLKIAALIVLLAVAFWLVDYYVLGKSL